MIIKQRARANVIDRMDLVGSVDGCDAIIVDDMVSLVARCFFFVALCSLEKEFVKTCVWLFEVDYGFPLHSIFLFFLFWRRLIRPARCARRLPN